VDFNSGGVGDDDTEEADDTPVETDSLLNDSEL